MVPSRRLLPIVLAVLIWDSWTLSQARDAESVLAATREALGGDKNLVAVKTDVAGPPPFAARLVIRQDTHLPVMLIWNAPAPPPGGRGGGPPGAPPAGAAPPGATPPRGAEPAGPLPENRLYFADYRDVKGTKWPFRIRRAVGGNPIEGTTFERINVNLKIDPK